MSTRRRQSCWHWPGWGQLFYAIGLGLAETVVFAVVYGGAAWITHQHSFRVRVHLDADLAIPLVPMMAVCYLSLNILLWLAPLVLRTRRELKSLVLSLAVATCIAGAVFILLPVDDAFPRPTNAELGQWKDVFDLARLLALDHNYLPSLHVTFTWICVSILSRQASSLGKPFWWIWAGLIIVSTLLTHQHYLIDVVTGIMLGWACVRWVYRPLLGTSPLPEDQAALASLSRDQGLLA